MNPSIGCQSAGRRVAFLNLHSAIRGKTFSVNQSCILLIFGHAYVGEAPLKEEALASQCDGTGWDMGWFELQRAAKFALHLSSYRTSCYSLVFVRRWQTSTHQTVSFPANVLCLLPVYCVRYTYPTEVLRYTRLYWNTAGILPFCGNISVIYSVAGKTFWGCFCWEKAIRTRKQNPETIVDTASLAVVSNSGRNGP